jgi:hypothetical protein
MDEYNELRQRAELNKKRREELHKKFLEDSKEKLGNISERKVRTSFIGALAQFEAFFGFLWGQVSPEDLTDEQLEILDLVQQKGFDVYLKDLWNKAREKVLTNGNNQIRGLKDEFQQYTIEWNRYKTILPVKTPAEVLAAREIKKEDK